MRLQSRGGFASHQRSGKRGASRSAVGFRSIGRIVRGSALGEPGAPRGEIGFRSIQSIARKSVYSRLSPLVRSAIPRRSCSSQVAAVSAFGFVYSLPN